MPPRSRTSVAAKKLVECRYRKQELIKSGQWENMTDAQKVCRSGRRAGQKVKKARRGDERKANEVSSDANFAWRRRRRARLDYSDTDDYNKGRAKTPRSRREQGNAMGMDEERRRKDPTDAGENRGYYVDSGNGPYTDFVENENDYSYQDQMNTVEDENDQELANPNNIDNSNIDFDITYNLVRRQYNGQPGVAGNTQNPNNDGQRPDTQNSFVSSARTPPDQSQATQDQRTLQMPTLTPPTSASTTGRRLPVAQLAAAADEEIRQARAMFPLPPSRRQEAPTENDTIASELTNVGPLPGLDGGGDTFGGTMEDFFNFN